LDTSFLEGVSFLIEFLNRWHAEIFILILFGIFGVILLIAILPFPEQKFYDCSLSEISPDFPIEVKQACREAKRMKR